MNPWHFYGSLVFLTLVAFGTVAGLVGMFYGTRAGRHLRNHHPETWQVLGEPKGLYRGVGEELGVFMKERRYRSLHDDSLTRLCDRTENAFQVARTFFYVALIALPFVLLPPVIVTLLR